MINFKDRDLAGPSAVIVAALVILLCTVIFYVAVPVADCGWHGDPVGQEKGSVGNRD